MVSDRARVGDRVRVGVRVDGWMEVYLGKEEEVVSLGVEANRSKGTRQSPCHQRQQPCFVHEHLETRKDRPVQKGPRGNGVG